MINNFSGISIESVIGVIPKNISYYDDEMDNYDHDRQSNEKLKALMGYGEHRVELQGRTALDYATYGVAELINRGVINKDEVDALFFISQTPDYIIPPTSSVLHGKLNLKEDVYCVDINDGCNGYIKGIFEACLFLSAKECGSVLLVAGDILSRLVSKRDRNSYPLVGDAVTISVVRKNRNSSCKLNISIKNNGCSYEKLIVPAGGARLPITGCEEMERDAEGNWRSSRNLRMNGRDVFAFTQTVVPRFIEDFLIKIDRDIKSFDKVFAHQANAFIIDRLRKKFDLSLESMPDRVVRNYGNSSSATIPMLLATEAKDMEDIDCLLVGFGVGLSWGACSVKIATSAFQGILEI